MTTRDHNFAGYKHVALVNEGELRSDIKPIADSRQNSGFSDYFEVDRSNQGQDVYQPGPYDQFMERMNSLWVWESASIVLSLAALAAAVCLLLYLDGTNLRGWTMHIKPNAVLAILMTIAKSSILVAIAAGIAQLKWLYYGSAPRRLADLDVFDRASRGPWGAVRFLFTLNSGRGKAKLVASVGAMLTVLALAMDPFAQQLLSYEVRLNPQPALSNQTWVPATFSHDVSRSLFKSSDLRKALYGGLLQVDYPIDYRCGSGNCTWDSFVSLGANGRCQDVAATVDKSCLAGAGVLYENCTQLIYAIPSYNLSITLQNGSANGVPSQRTHTFTKGVTSSLYPFTRKSPVQFRFAVAQLLIDIDTTTTIRNASQLQIPSWNITACSIEWCAKVYNDVRVTNGTFNEPPPEVVGLVPTEKGSCPANTTSTCQNFEAADKSRLPKAMADTIFTNAADGGKASVRDMLSFDYNITSQTNSSSLSATEAYSVVSTLFWNTNITETALRVTTAYTNFLRSNENATPTRGTTWADETYIEVRWVWFSLPAILVLGSTAFLIVVIITSKLRGDASEPLWKASTLPLLLHGVGWSGRREYHRADSSTAINSVTRGAKAQLRRNIRGEATFVKVN